MPAAAKPRGTPVCLTENTSDMRWAGVVWLSRCELAGVMGPYPRPMSAAASAAPGIAFDPPGHFGIVGEWCTLVRGY